MCGKTAFAASFPDERFETRNVRREDDSTIYMKAPLTLICAAFAAVATVRAATTAELIKQLEIAANAEVRAGRKKSDGGRIAPSSGYFNDALAQFVFACMEPENLAGLKSAIGHLQASSTSEATVKAAVALNAQLVADATARQAKRMADLEETGERSAEQGLAAKTAWELDGPLSELTRTMTENRSSSARGIPGLEEMNAQFTQLQTLKNFLQNRQDYFVKMEAGDPRQALACLRNIGSSSDLAAISWVPRSVLLATIQRDQKAAQPAIDTSEETVKKLGAKILTIEAAVELDAVIAELSALAEPSTNYEDGSERKGAALARSTLEFARRWQDFLAARAAGNVEKARSVLSELTGLGRDYPGVPRSAILARAYGEEIGKTGGKKTTGPVASLASPEQILEKIKSLEDLDRLLPEFSAAITGDRGTWSNVLNDLQTLARTYRELRAGNSTRISLGLSGLDSTREPVAALRGQLAIYALPRILSVKDEDKPLPTENALTYLRRMLALARDRKDWQFASRIHSVVQTTQVSDPLLRTADSTALSSFLAALNLEKGRQYSLAVNSFQTALKTGSDFIPAEEIGEHLEAIKRDHPADYEAGLQLTITPPAPTTDAFGRPLRDVRGYYPPGYPGYPAGANPNATNAPAKEQTVPVPAKVEPSEPATKPAPPASEPKAK